MILSLYRACFKKGLTCFASLQTFCTTRNWGRGERERKRKKPIFHTENKDAKIFLSVSEILELVVHGVFGEFAGIISPKTDSTLSSCFSITFRRVLAPKAGFQIVQWWGARQSDSLVGRTVRRGPGNHQSTTAINSSSRRARAREQQEFGSWNQIHQCQCRPC